MQNALLGIVGLSCVVGSGFVVFRLAPRAGSPSRAWLENDGAATVVTLGLMLVGTLGMGMLIQALVG